MREAPPSPVWYNHDMDRVVRKFRSHTDAAAADRAYYRSLTPQQRLDVMLDIIASQRGTDEASQRLARVYRIVKRIEGQWTVVKEAPALYGLEDKPSHDRQ